MNYGRQLGVLRSHGWGGIRNRLGESSRVPMMGRECGPRFHGTGVREVPVDLQAPAQEWRAAVDKQTDLGLSGSLDGS